MRSKSLGITFLAALAMLLFTANNSQAFHSGGVAECSGCHSMHAPNPNGFSLLVGQDPSSTCLSCHERVGDTGPTSYHISTADADLVVGTAPFQRTPGGDFAWLKKSYTFTVRSSSVTEDGETHGHNIVAADKAYVADLSNPTAPGGLFPSANLGCTSCHDPHGRVRRISDGTFTTGAALGFAGNPIRASGSYSSSPIPGAGEAVGTYRLLRGLNDSTVPGVTFAGVAVAVVPSSYNRTEAVTQTRVAYGSGAGANTWGNWCASCHPDMHSSTNYVHPVDQNLSTGVINNYNAYVKSGDLTGAAATAFSSLVPFAENTTDFATLAPHAVNNDTQLSGPASGSKVTCLSCHRSHASGFPNMLRWNMDYEFIVYGGLYAPAANTSVGRGRTELEMAGAYYDRPATVFASYQRVLCNKCHAKD